ncbi:MAG TPA: ABC transporter substrate-binding protein, partial [Nitrososphaerales archaeon]|nr:ABC transporter substrate-binding protein [Nitrososphaerales archaeon]
MEFTPASRKAISRTIGAVAVLVIIVVAVIAAYELTAKPSSTNSNTSTSTGSGTSTGSFNSSSVVNVAFSDGGQSVDPAICTDDLTSYTFCQNIYQALVTVGQTTQSNGETILDMTKRAPLLASSWTEATNGSQWVFKLVQNATFSNGDKFNSSDVLFTVNRCFTMGFTCAFFLGLAGITNSSTKIIDKYTVEFNVTPGPFMLQALLFMPIV